MLDDERRDDADAVNELDGRQPHPTALTPPGPATARRRRRFVATGAVAGAVGLLTALFVFGLGHDPTVVRSALLGRPAPPFSLPPLEASGGTVTLSSLRGQVVVVNFWASWCADCRVEHPSLQAAWQRYQDQGVVFVGVPFEDRRPASLRYAHAMGGGWPLVQDPGARTALAYGVYGVPETFVIGADGRVVFKQVGPVSYGVLSDQITRALSRRTR